MELKKISEIQHSPLPVESTFNEFVLSVDGRLISKQFTKSPLFKNADYLFESDMVVAELKCLTEDLAKPNYICTVIKKYKDWFGDSAIKALFDPDMLNKKQKLFMFDLIKKPLRRVILKANKQIKETKEVLSLDNYRGLFLLCNDGLFGVPTRTIINACCNLLSKNFSYCDGFVYFTLNKYSRTPNSQNANLLWVPFYGDNAGELDQFVNILGKKWFKFLEGKIGKFEMAESLSYEDILYSDYIKNDD